MNDQAKQELQQSLEQLTLLKQALQQMNGPRRAWCLQKIEEVIALQRKLIDKN